ncbi:CrcB family protein [Roseomonas sp. CECT 9278]|uniref:fluoride efflux transporter FluC n=1 Tax=Roseomonas sp. CECT 9278 TaxID=2845823 RepID=UPI001E57FD6C|nr:CrcB family protein [Roseomonas sp. CECT 9278]CAH0305213.1 Putative fluoride ion transporter CrcB [Roseomonas sp. CECT 9278]
MPAVSLQGVLLVALGGALGSVLRYGVSLAGLALFGAGFPWGTLAVNIIGSAAIGALAAIGIDGHARALLIPGFLGGFTTFSAFSLEATFLWDRSPALAALYVALSVGLGLAACLVGFWLFRR